MNMHYVFQVAGASYSSNIAVFEPGAKHTFDEGVGKFK